MYAECLIEYPIKALDKTFIYLIPTFLKQNLRIGMKVLVPFNNRVVHGIVLKITDEKIDNYELKEIVRIEDEFLVLNDELLQLGKFLKEETLCNLITAYQTMLPSSLKIKTQDSNYIKYDSFVSLIETERNALEFIMTHKGKKVEIIKRLLEEGEINKKELNSNSVRELEKRGFIKIIKKEKYRIIKENKNEHHLSFNLEQKQAFDQISSFFGKSKTFLLYGVTGSGKTLVYIELIKKALEKKKTALLLVPEISLTQQIISIFYNEFGNDVAILHSGLSKGEKYDEYKKILNKDVHIVIGTRSAVFAPIENIGIIIMDEEHSETYKQQSTPRYHARDIVLKRSEYHKCPVVLGSATPSLESMARAKKDVYKLITMENRALGQKLPIVKIVDMASEVKKRNFVISEELDIEIKKRLEKKEQIILLLNRRGYSTIITCSNCGFTYKCPHCEISLTYHKSSNTLRCHYCGYTKLKDDICPKCHEKSLNYLGLGTEKLENILNEKYNHAKLIRMDADTTSKKGSHDRIIKAFKDHEADILIGTQMISKGLDFSNCTLVGIINADSTLNIPDYKSSERTFSLLDQASGRAGRSNIEGLVIIQTFNPSNAVIEAVKKHDYEGFYQNEMSIRKKLKYPPYYYLVSIKVCSKDYQKASIESSKIVKHLRKELDPTSIILGPSTALNFKLKNIYRFHIIIKYRFDKRLKEELINIDSIYKINKDVYLEIDFNPLSF